VSGAGEAVELVILDCDGVLVDSERLAVRVEARLISAMGWEIDEDEVLRRFVGRSDAHMRREIERELGRPVPEWDARYASALSAAFRAELEAVPGVVAALDRLTVPTCVASSGTFEKMALTLGLTGLAERFTGRIHSATEVAAGKPAPDLFLHAASRMGVVPARCVVVEDSAAGVQAARAAGMRSLGYAGGLTPASWLEGPGTVVFDDMADLVDLVASLSEPSGPSGTRPTSGGST
jgi:HAD superfamily hydrolase (TIGR01509 family)